MCWGPKIITDWNTWYEATKLSVLSLVVITTLHAATVAAPPRCLSKSHERYFSVNRKFWMPSLLGKHASFQNEINVIWFSVISLSIQPYAKNIPLGNNSLESFFVHMLGQTNNSVICEKNLSFLEQVHFVSGLTSRKFNIISSRVSI